MTSSGLFHDFFMRNRVCSISHVEAYPSSTSLALWISGLMA